MFNAEKETTRLSTKISTEILKSYKPSSPAILKAAKLIQKHKKFILTTHVGSDADGIGSQIGLYFLLKALKKECVIINCEAPPSNLQFMTEKVTIVDYQVYADDPSLLAQQLEGYFAFILDSSEIHRSKPVSDLFLQAGCSWATIDHHVLKAKGNMCVDNSYAATAEMIWDLYKHFKIKINNDGALALYTGLVADSGNFRYSKTSLRTHLAGGELLGNGIHSDMVYRAIYESNPIDRLHYLQRIYKNLLIDKRLGLVAATILPKTKKGLQLGDSANDGIVNQLMSVKGIHISSVMTKTEDNFLKASLRSVGDYDVASIAKKFGGGGHFNAAGLKIEQPFKKARKMLLEEIQKYLQTRLSE